MGLFGGLFGKDMPTLNIPEYNFSSASDLYGSAADFAKEETPYAYGAREGALADLALGNEYYDQFQPSSFEEALANQYFDNIWPDTQREIKHALSMSGIESSPILAEQLGKAYGDISYDIGKYLSELGNERAINSLNARLGIDPYSQIMTPFVGVDQTQQQNQANYNITKAQADYQNAMQKYNAKKSGISSIGSLAGMVAGGLLAIPSGGLSLAAMPAIMGGASLGGSLGGTAASLFGGSQTPISLGDALSIADWGGTFNTPKAKSVAGIPTPKGYKGSIYIPK